MNRGWRCSLHGDEHEGAARHVATCPDGRGELGLARSSSGRSSEPSPPYPEDAPLLERFHARGALAHDEAHGAPVVRVWSLAAAGAALASSSGFGSAPRSRPALARALVVASPARRYTSVTTRRDRRRGARGRPPALDNERGRWQCNDDDDDDNDDDDDDEQRRRPRAASAVRSTRRAASCRGRARHGGRTTVRLSMKALWVWLAVCLSAGV